MFFDYFYTEAPLVRQFQALELTEFDSTSLTFLKNCTDAFKEFDDFFAISEVHPVRTDSRNNSLFEQLLLYYKVCSGPQDHTIDPRFAICT